MVSLSVIFHLRRYNSAIHAVMPTSRWCQRRSLFITNNRRPYLITTMCLGCLAHGLKHLVVLRSSQHKLGLYWHLFRFWFLPYCTQAAFSSDRYCSLFCQCLSFSSSKPGSALNKSADPLWSSRRPVTPRGMSHSISLASFLLFNWYRGSRDRFSSLPQDSSLFVLLPREVAHELGEWHLPGWGQQLWKFWVWESCLPALIEFYLVHLFGRSTSFSRHWLSFLYIIYQRTCSCSWATVSQETLILHLPNRQGQVLQL